MKTNHSSLAHLRIRNTNSVPIAVHLVGHIAGGKNPFTHPDACRKLWTLLRRYFPDAVAAVVMPNHFHLVALRSAAPFPNTASCERRLELVKQASAHWLKRHGARWQPLKDIREIPNTLHLQRHIRYVHLNPCRSHLARDPLAWEWSTHRELRGLTLGNWPDLRLLHSFFRRSSASWHQYISGDPTVAIAGTPLPSLVIANAGAFVVGSLSQLDAVATSVTRGYASAAEKRDARGLSASFAKENRGLARSTPRRSSVYRLNALYRQKHTPAEVRRAHGLLSLYLMEPRLAPAAEALPRRQEPGSRIAA